MAWQGCRHTAAWLVTGLVLASCGEPQPTAPGQDPEFAKGGNGGAPSPATIVVEPVSATLAVGGTVQLTATGYDRRGNEIGPVTVTWSSANTAMATVNATGLVTGVAAVHHQPQQRMASCISSGP